MTSRSSIGLILLAFGVCAHAQEPAATAIPTADQQAGRVLFNASCAYCHGERGHATTLLAKRLGKENALLERRTSLNPALIRHVVRRGINSMPWYRRAELSDRELASITAYLTRSNPQQEGEAKSCSEDEISCSNR